MKSRMHDELVTLTNTPKLREKTIVLGLSYFYAGINNIIYGIMKGETDGVFIGIILILFVPIAITDNRKENRGTGAVIGGIILNLIVCIILSKISSFWWILVFLGETIISIIAVRLPYHPSHKQ